MTNKLENIPAKELLKNLIDNGGHPNETEDSSDRMAYIEEFERRGADKILTELGCSLDRKTLWRNRWTGDEETLEELFNGEIAMETEDQEIMFIVENWIEAHGKNTIKEEYERRNREVELPNGSIQQAMI
jgi:hypothetical protein